MSVFPLIASAAGKSIASKARVPRQDHAGADRTSAERYQFNDVLHYSRTSTGWLAA